MSFSWRDFTRANQIANIRNSKIHQINAHCDHLINIVRELNYSENSAKELIAGIRSIKNGLLDLNDKSWRYHKKRLDND